MASISVPDLILQQQGNRSIWTFLYKGSSSFSCCKSVRCVEIAFSDSEPIPLQQQQKRQMLSLLQACW